MYFEPSGIYHIYNQGNNRQPVFFNHENYRFFLRKIRIHILPFADILAWCLMPNHFHLMVEVKGPASRGADIFSRGATQSRTPTKEPNLGAISGRTSINEETGQSFNHSIGVLLSSYTKAINKQNNTTGSLFRQKTKAICLNEIKGISSHWYTSFGVTFMKVDIPEYQYPQTCFNYIHHNPVKAGLVVKAEDWEFSSYVDLVGMRDGTLVNRERVEKLGLICISGARL
jgi:putative transposase